MDIKRWFTARLTARWFRYIAIPTLAGMPAGLAALWFALHPAGQPLVQPHYFLEGDQPWVTAGIGAWVVGLTILKSYLDEIAKDAIKTLETAQRDLASLLESVRFVVGSKSKRFYAALKNLPREPKPEQTFFEITRPDLQIKQLIDAARAYFQIKIDPESIEIRVKLSLMKPDGVDLLITDWAPDADVPNAQSERFRDSTLAGRAFHSRELIISENVADDDRYRHFGAKKDQGSMFSYPVVDNLLDRVVYVINVMTSQIGIFKDTPKEREKIQKAMEIYAERIVLENRLDELKTRILAKRSAGVAR